MSSSSLIVAFFCFGAAFAALPVPPYMKPCPRNDPGFEACAVKTAHETIKNVLNGDRKYNIPAINPLEIPEIKVENQGPQQAGIDIKMTNAKFYGFKDTIVKAITLNYEKKKLHLKLEIPHLQLTSEYEISGRILLLPITGKGPLNITLEDITLQFDTDWVVEKKDGSEFLKLANSRLHDVVPKRVHYDLQNLFNGDKLLGPEMITVLNQNWKDAFEEVSPPIVQALNAVIISIINNIASVVDYQHIFPLKV